MNKNWNKEQQDLFDHVGNYLNTIISADKNNTPLRRTQIYDVLMTIVLTFKAFCYLSDVRDQQLKGIKDANETRT